METLPKDVRMKIALDLSPPDLVRFCVTETKQNKEICGSETFWRQKLEKDYPEEFLNFYQTGIPVKNPKATYIRNFTRISEEIEDFTEEFIEVIIDENIGKYLNKKYREDLFKIFFDIYTQALLAMYDDYDIVENSGLKEMVFNVDVDYEEWINLTVGFINNLTLHEKLAMDARKEAIKLKSKK